MGSIVLSCFVKSAKEARKAIESFNEAISLNDSIELVVFCLYDLSEYKNGKIKMMRVPSVDEACLAGIDVGINFDLDGKVEEVYRNYKIPTCEGMDYKFAVLEETDATFDGNRLFLINRMKGYSILKLETFSELEIESGLDLIIDKSRLPESEILLDRKYVTPNYIDFNLWGNFNSITISGKGAKRTAIRQADGADEIRHDDQTFLVDPSVYKKTPEYSKSILANRIAFIGDIFTYMSLKDILNVEYVSSHSEINVESYDFLLCESTWAGVDGSWRYVLTRFKTEQGSALRETVRKFKDAGKKCVFYNKEDPIGYKIFSDSASLFDIIITTSEKSMSNYLKDHPGKTLLNIPFCCNPRKHNPIGGMKKLKEACFIGGFYRHIDGRQEDTERLFDSVLEKEIPFRIINRHYFMPKFSCQIAKKERLNRNCKLSEKYGRFNNPPVDSKFIEQEYKKYALQLNVNSITDCGTMFSRRLVEMLGCGCNVYSNRSRAIEMLGLPVILDLDEVDINGLNEINLDGFLTAHMNYSYVDFIKKICEIVEIPVLSNIEFSIGPADREGKKVIVMDEGVDDPELVKKALIHMYFFEGNIGFTKDKGLYYSVKKMEDDCRLIVRDKESEELLLIPEFS